MDDSSEPKRPWHEKCRSLPLRQFYLAATACISLVLLASAFPLFRDKLTNVVPSDLRVDYLTAKAFKAGYSPFTREGARRAELDDSPTGNAHPPTTSFWLLPLTNGSLKAAAFVVGLLTLCLLLLQTIATNLVLDVPCPLATGWLVFACVSSSQFMACHLAAGQWSGLIGFLCFAAWLAARRGDDWLAGIALGAATTLKFFPAVVVLLFVVLGRWRIALAACTVFLAVATVMTSRFGLHSWPLFFANQSAVADIWMDSVLSHSIHGVVLRFFRPACGPHGGPLLVSTLISSTLAAALLFVAGWWSRQAIRAGGSLDLPVALFIVLSSLVFPVAWEHYSIIDVFPATVAAVYLVREWRSGLRWPFVALGFLLLLALVASWQLSYLPRLELQQSARAGAREVHLDLHFREIANWLPPLGLALLLGALLRRSLASLVPHPLSRTGDT